MDGGHPETDAERFQDELDDRRMKALGWRPDKDADPLEGTTPTSEPLRGRLVNVETRWVKTPEGKPVAVSWYRKIEDVGNNLREIAGGWPKVCNGIPFALHRHTDPIAPPNVVRYFAKTVDLFAWISEVSDLHWKSKGDVRSADGPATPSTKEEFHAHIKNLRTERYCGVATVPHVPEVPGIYYLPCQLPESDGEALREFLEALNPETEDDRLLLLAMILTPMWGGSCGQRPAFVLSAKTGVSSGKTATAHAIGMIYDGAFELPDGEEWRETSRHLMDDEALNRRVLLADNVKGTLSSRCLEILVTSPTISGHRMYVGGMSRPNLMTLFVTSNVPRLSRDLSSRSINVRIGGFRHGVDFIAWTGKFMSERRAALLADIRAVLMGPDRGKISSENRDRFGEWQGGVLQKIDGCDRLAALIIERRKDTDADAERAEAVADAVEDWVRKYNPPKDREGRSKITRDQMHELLKAAHVTPDDMGKNAIHTLLCNLMGSNGPLGQLEDSTRRDEGPRCWLWTTTEDLPPI